MCVCACVCVCVCTGKSLSLQHLRAGVAALKLSPPVSQQNVKMVFDSMDSDGSCTIDYHELSSLLEQPPLRPAQAPTGGAKRATSSSAHTASTGDRGGGDGKSGVGGGGGGGGGGGSGGGGKGEAEMKSDLAADEVEEEDIPQAHEESMDYGEGSAGGIRFSKVPYIVTSCCKHSRALTFENCVREWGRGLCGGQLL
jgi:hypothetical protein